MNLIKKILRFFLLKPITKLVKVQTQKEEKKVKSKIELCKVWVEELLLSTDMELENVFVHNLGNWGVCGKSPFGYTKKTTTDGVTRKFMIPKTDKAYIFVPEIVDTWTIHAWLHEIGHYVLGHCDDSDKPIYIKEYEAEKYSIDKGKECPHINDFMMVDIEVDARWYVFSCLINDIKKGKTTKSTMDENVKQYLLSSKYIGEVFDKECDLALAEYTEKTLKTYEDLFVNL